MPGRLVPLVTDEIYHVYNRTIDDKRVFLQWEDYNRGYQALNYYRFRSFPVSLSKLNTYSIKVAWDIIAQLEISKQHLVEIFAFCIMPNHFHILLKQKKDSGISVFLSNFQNSYTRYFNTKKKRRGQIFLNRFKAKRVTDEAGFYHLSRYIHLNPYSAKIIGDINRLENFEWSSFPEYMNKEKKRICNTDMVLAHFLEPEKYKKFIFDRADYQRTLQEIKTLL